MITTYELLTGSLKDLLSETFGCEVYTQYGGSEVLDVANECEYHRLHVMTRNVWVEVTELRAAPVGTRWVRVRMITRRPSSFSNDGIFDGFSLRALGTPVYTITDERVLEGDVGTVGMRFDVGIQCEFDQQVKYVILSHDHADHSAGGEVFAQDGALVVAHEKAKVQIIGERRPTASPNITFNDQMTVNWAANRSS